MTREVKKPAFITENETLFSLQGSCFHYRYFPVLPCTGLQCMIIYWSKSNFFYFECQEMDIFGIKFFESRSQWSYHNKIVHSLGNKKFISFFREISKKCAMKPLHYKFICSWFLLFFVLLEVCPDFFYLHFSTNITFNSFLQNCYGSFSVS